MTADSVKTIVKYFSSEPEAALASNLLEQHGIQASVCGLSRYRAMAGGGYGVRISQQELAQARAILAQVQRDLDMDEYVDADDRSYRRCPRCNSVNIVTYSLDKKPCLLALLTLGLAFTFIKRERRCRKCGHEWRA